MESRKLNLNIVERVSEFELLMKDFLLKNQVYQILFRGKGLEFDSYRDYAPDDDAQDIDWKASARANKPLVKRYIEERDLKIMILVDVSDNMIMGSTEKLKCEYAAEAAVSLGHLIITSGDKLGFGFFNNHVVKMVFPEKGMKQFERFVYEISDPILYGGKSDVTSGIENFLSYFDESFSSVVIISDFIKIRRGQGILFELFAKRFETMAIAVRDPLDMTMPDIKGEIVLENPETAEQIIVDPSVARRLYEQNALEQERFVKHILEDSGIDFLSLTTDKPFPPLLAEFLNERVEKKKYLVFK
ncbi:MAG: DUF58 domain-containing protein [Nanoarchaeota archaeon]|nr:DUF58 domain-containing protein [Nanoarchaeota archaeon]MBU4086678.1 DUF58 domain-containing protein [Nanoarchaeota archaeon]